MLVALALIPVTQLIAEMAVDNTRTSERASDYKSPGQSRHRNEMLTLRRGWDRNYFIRPIRRNLNSASMSVSV